MPYMDLLSSSITETPLRKRAYFDHLPKRIYFEMWKLVRTHTLAIFDTLNPLIQLKHQCKRHIGAICKTPHTPTTTAIMRMMSCPEAKLNLNMHREKNISVDQYSAKVGREVWYRKRERVRERWRLAPLRKHTHDPKWKHDILKNTSTQNHTQHPWGLFC